VLEISLQQKIKTIKVSMLFFKRRPSGDSLQATSHAPILHEDEGYLTGQLLIATPQLNEPPSSLTSPQSIFIIARSWPMKTARM
jgi:hypothetical protein